MAKKSKSKSISLQRIIVLFFLVVGVLILGLYAFYSIALFPWHQHFPSDSEKQFKNQCVSINGKEFTYDNLSKIDGYITMGGKLSKEDVDESLQNNKQIVIYEHKNFNEGWDCVINPQNGLIVSEVNYYSD